MERHTPQPMMLTRPVLAILAGLVTLALLGLVAHRMVISLHYADSDFFTFWLGGRFVVSGLDPYDPAVWTAAHARYGAVWIPNPAYVYPLPLAILMAPLGAIDLLAAYQIWVVLSAVMILAAGWLAFGRPARRGDLAFIIPWLAGVLLFRPVIVTLRNGQLGGLLLFVLVLGCSLAADQRDWAAGIVLGLLSLKPALGLPILGLLGLWMMTRRRWRFVAGAGLVLVLLFLVGWMVDPAWVSQLAGSGSPKLFFNLGYFPTAWGLGTALCAGRGACGLWVGGLLGAGGLAAFGAAAFIRRGSMDMWEAASLAVPAALFASPYVGVYDLLLLLLPIGTSLRLLRLSRAPYLAVATLPIWIDLVSLSLILVAAHIGLDLWSSILDLLVLALAWVAIRLPPFNGSASPASPAPAA